MNVISFKYDDVDHQESITSFNNSWKYNINFVMISLLKTGVIS